MNRLKKPKIANKNKKSLERTVTNTIDSLIWREPAGGDRGEGERRREGNRESS